MTDEQPKFCVRCGRGLPPELVCSRCGHDSSDWRSWVPIAVCRNGHVVEVLDRGDAS